LGKILGGDAYQNGALDRAKAREILFSDADKRRAVEALLHPRIAREFERQADKAKAEGHPLVICEAALLMEAGIDKQLDGLILVSAPEALRTGRVVERDRIGAVLAQKMIRAQLKDADRPKSHTTISIQNDGSLADLSMKVADLLQDWRNAGWLTK
jgi:dephospho-CoA kinase